MAEKSEKLQFKVCGLTRLDDLVGCLGLGVPWIGFNLYPKSKRFVPLETAVELWRQAQQQQPGATTQAAVVAVDISLKEVDAIVKAFPGSGRDTTPWS
jgi:Phosphoribosylanthranilate isomerase